MKTLEAYRDAAKVKQMKQILAQLSQGSYTLMEICGGQTHTIMQYGLDTLLPDNIRLIHGPGCPVCVTPLAKIDKALTIASLPNVIFTTFGDMLRVPGSHSDLLRIKAEGGDVRMVYSPLDALALAEKYPDKEVVFFSVGFETTVPATAMAVFQAKQKGLSNFSLLVSHVLVPPAMHQLLSSESCAINGFLAAGHVCTVMGYEAYHAIASQYRVPIVVTGFEPLDILQGVTMCIQQLEEGRSEVENQYARSVQEKGNTPAQAMIERVFHTVDLPWRGLGVIPKSGLTLKPDFAPWDAEQKFPSNVPDTQEPKECQSGLVLQGLLRPTECSAFGTKCTPDTPLGAPMVSSEGACAAYYQYRQHSE